MKTTKKQKRKLMKRKLSIGILLFAAVFIIFLSSNTSSARAAYTSSIEVDCFKNEGSYELIIDDTDWDVWYANNNSRHFIYANFTYFLAGHTITIYTSEFSYDLSPSFVHTSFLISKHENTSLELEIERSLVGNQFRISVDTDIIVLSVSPKDTATPAPPPVVIEGEDKVETVYADPLDRLEADYKKHPFLALFHGFLWGIFITSIAIGGKYYTNKLREYPIPFVINCVSEEDWHEILPKLPKTHTSSYENEEFNITQDMVKLGRYLREKGTSKFTEKFVLEFKSVRGFVLEVHCDEHFAQINTSRKRRVNIYQTDMVDYQLMAYMIPAEKRPFKQVLKKGAKNKLRHFFAKHIPIRGLALRLRDKVEYINTKERLTKVLYLIHRDGKERLKLIADFKYKQLVADEKDSEKYEWTTKEAQPLFFRELLENDPTVKKKTIRFYHLREVIDEVDPHLRDVYRESEDNLRIHRIRIEQKLLHKLKIEKIRRLELEEKQVDMKADLEEEYQCKLIDMRSTFLKPLETFSNKFAPKYEKTGNFEESRKQALIDLYKDEDHQKLKKLQEKYEEKIQMLDDPNLVNELITTVNVQKNVIEMFMKGNGKPKSDMVQLLGELDKINSSTKET